VSLGATLGILGLNAILIAVGLCVMAPFLRGRSTAGVASCAGVALFVAVGVVSALLTALAVAGARVGVVTFLATSAAVATVGILVATTRRGPPRGGFLTAPAMPRRAFRGERELAICGGAVVLLGGLLLMRAGFRGGPWLDDSWTMWLPKGLVLDQSGLDPRVFVAENDTYKHFASLNYPLAWSILSNLDVKFAGELDVRAMNAQLGIMSVAFLGAVARMLWGHVRPVLVLGVLMFLLLCPEFVRQSQSGGADIPLAAILALFVLAAVGWLRSAHPGWLLLIGSFAAAAVAMKAEGAPQTLLFLTVIAAFGGWRRWRRTVVLAAVSVGALLTSLPWTLWKHEHHVKGVTNLGDALSIDYLRDHTERLDLAVEALARHATASSEWLVLVPAVIVVSSVAAILDRRLVWLTPVGLLAASFLFWSWAYWGDSEEIHYRLGTSAYRVIDAPLIASLVLAALGLERVVDRWMRQRATPTGV
jgi:4-amino-4-deoxy-L-arabinose transferase-like glycosyltransferase